MGGRKTLDAADQLVNEARPGAPRQVNLRCAVSMVCHALAHWLANCVADVLAGATRPRDHGWVPVYRGVNHRQVKQQCRQGRIPTNLAPTLRRFAAELAEMQGRRHSADYIPRHASQSETLSPSSQAPTGCFWISRKQPRPKNARLPSTFSSRNDLARSDPAEGRLAARSPPTYSRNAPITCARTATAISSGVRAPIGTPTGPWIRSRSAAAKPSAPRRSRLAPWVLRLPSAPM